MTALAAYHFGPTAVDRERKIPLETLNYIQKVFNEKSYILASDSFQKNLVCRPTDLQNLTIETHDPRKRRDKAIDWINGSAERLLYLRAYIRTEQIGFLARHG